MAAPKIDSTRQTSIPDSHPNDAPAKSAKATRHDSESNAVVRHPGRRPLDHHSSPAFVPANPTVSGAPNVAEATKLANDLAASIAGHHSIEFKLVSLVRDQEGHVRRVEEEGSIDFNLSLPNRPTRLDPSNSSSYGLTPVLSTDAFELSLPQAKGRGVVDTARTIIHEWAHTAVNRGLMERSDPRAAYDLVAKPIGLWESLSYKSPTSGEFVQVTPSGDGVSVHEMAGQYAGALFDKALADRAVKRP
jgi:hypothetical protein